MHLKCRSIYPSMPPAVFARLWVLMVVGAVAPLAPGQGALAQTEIHKCAAKDGSVVYQQLPCADEAAKKENAPPPQTRATEHVPESRDVPRQLRQPPQPGPADQQRDTADVDACRQRYRDAIDRIDAEISNGIPADEIEEYRGRARALSQALSHC